MISRLPRPLGNYCRGLGSVISSLQLFSGYSDSDGCSPLLSASCWQNWVAKLFGGNVFLNQSPSIPEKNAEDWI